MSTKRRDNIAQLDSFILKLNTGQREDLIARQSPEDQEAIRQAMQGGGGGAATVEEEKIAPPPPLVELKAPAPGTSQEAVERLDRAAKGKEEKKRQEVFRAEVAGRVAERKREEAAITAQERFAAKAFNLGNGVFHGTRGFLESKPTPGGIGVPLAILLFFFFLLLPVNGHTRFMWLWLTLTGNAELGGPLPAPTLTPQGAPVSATTPNNIVTAVEAQALATAFPGVQGVQNFIAGLLGQVFPGTPPQTSNPNAPGYVPPAGTQKNPIPVGPKGIPISGRHGTTGSTRQPPINQQSAQQAQQNQRSMHGPHGGGPDHLSNLNGHAKSYGDLLSSLGDY